jgi:DNA polymerase III subunit epsilon
MALVLGVDVETTGLDSGKDRVTELGCVLWDTDNGQPVSILSRFIEQETVITPEITDITGITQDMLKAPFADPSSLVWSEFLANAELADYFVAHNAPFDAGFIHAELEREGLLSQLPALKWIDTTLDIPFPKKIKGRALVTLCAEHGFLNPFPHRAVTDVLAMLKLMGMYNFTDIVLRTESPTLEYIAQVRSFADKDLARDRGFRWDPARKVWARNMKQMDFVRDEYPFPILVNEK